MNDIHLKAKWRFFLYRVSIWVALASLELAWNTQRSPCLCLPSAGIFRCVLFHSTCDLVFTENSCWHEETPATFDMNQYILIHLAGPSLTQIYKTSYWFVCVPVTAINHNTQWLCEQARALSSAELHQVLRLQASRPFWVTDPRSWDDSRHMLLINSP